MALPQLLCLSLVTCACSVLEPASNSIPDTRGRFGKVANRGTSRNSRRQGHSAAEDSVAEPSWKRGDLSGGNGRHRQSRVSSPSIRGMEGVQKLLVAGGC